MEGEIRTVDLTPTWSNIVPMLVLLIEHGNSEGRRTAWDQLYKMARLADERNEMARMLPEAPPYPFS